MNSQQVVKPLLTSRIVWAALTFSMLCYGFILYELGKATYVKIPESYTLLEIIALCLGMLLFVTFWIHEKKVKPEPDTNKRFPFYVMCWALNETMVVVAFAAIMTSENGNSFIYIVNFLLALIGNLIMFPVEAAAGKSVNSRNPIQPS